MSCTSSLGERGYALPERATIHNHVAGGFLGSIHAQLRAPCEAFSSDMRIRIRLPTHTRLYYPDGLIVRESDAPDSPYQDKPIVITEVLSEATRRIDEGEKREAYLTLPSLTAYLLIETARPRIVVYRRAEQNDFVPEFYEGIGAVIPLPSIGAELRLAELYARVDFAAQDAEPGDDAGDAV